jgi:hypothetical protein
MRMTERSHGKIRRGTTRIGTEETAVAPRNAYQQRYYEKNRETICAQMRAYSREYYARHRKRKNAAARRRYWKLKNERQLAELAERLEAERAASSPTA